MPITELPLLSTNIAQVQKINEIVQFLNSIQRAGAANYMIWSGDDTTVPRRPKLTAEEERRRWLLYLALTDALSSGADTSSPPTTLDPIT